MVRRHSIAASGALIFVLLWGCQKAVTAQQSGPVAAANNFLNTLDDDQKAITQFSLDDAERFNWHFIPRERRGITFANFSETQKAAALLLLRTSLSEQGYKKTMAIVHLEDILRQVEGRPLGDRYRDSLNYHFSIFGTPSASQPWGWRIEGHHISFNFTSQDNEIRSSTPGFLGSNPAIVPSGPEKSSMVLKTESDLGFRLVNSLTSDQLSVALISETSPHEIITGNSRKASLETMQGIPFGELQPEQQKMLMKLLDVYVDNYEMGFSKRFMDKIRNAGIENLHFVWAGSLSPGRGHYYRIQGPMLIIEFDNTQNNANHIHTVVRDLTNDFGEDILREHYAEDHKQ